MLTQIKAQVLELRKEKDPLAPFGLWLVSEIEKVGKNKSNRETTEDECIQLLKKLKDTLSNETEIAFVSTFIPAMLSDEEVVMFFRENDYTSLKEAMPALKRTYGSKVDMRRAKQLFEKTVC